MKITVLWLNNENDDYIRCLAITGVTKGSGVTDHHVVSISKKLTMLEMKELNERQRAEHAVRMYEQQKDILHNLEQRNSDLEKKFAEVLKWK